MPIKKLRLSVIMSDQYVKILEDLVERGIYLNRGEAIRAGISLLFKSHNLEFVEKESEG